MWRGGAPRRRWRHPPSPSWLDPGPPPALLLTLQIVGLLAVRSGLHPPLALEPLPDVARAADAAPVLPARVDLLAARAGERVGRFPGRRGHSSLLAGPASAHAATPALARVALPEPQPWFRFARQNAAVAPGTPRLRGVVEDAQTGQPLDRVLILSDRRVLAVSEEGRFPLPFPPRGVYLTFYGIGDREIRTRTLELLERTELNTLIIDVKGDRGLIS